MDVGIPWERNAGSLTILVKKIVVPIFKYAHIKTVQKGSWQAFYRRILYTENDTVADFTMFWLPIFPIVSELEHRLLNVLVELNCYEYSSMNINYDTRVIQ